MVLLRTSSRPYLVYPGLLVVARNSTMVYKGEAVDVKQVSREQGVQYVLEGSVRKAGNRVRVTLSLLMQPQDIICGLSGMTES